MLDIFTSSSPLSTRSVVVNGIVTNQTKSQQAVDEVTDLINQIGGFLESVGNAPTIDATIATLTTSIDYYQAPATPAPVSVIANFPSTPSLLEVTASFPLENGYQSSLLSSLQATLLGWVLNPWQTGLNPAVEQQLWDRARERTTATTQGLVDSITRQYARSGWILPQGDEIERVFQALEVQAEQDITESRAIAVAQADLEQKNFQFSLTQAQALEGLLSNLYSAIQQRALDAEKERLSSLNEINKNATDVYKSQVQAEAARIEGLTSLYKADAEIYGEQVTAEGSRINAQVAVQKQELEYLTKKADLSIESIKANVATFLSQKELIIGTLKTIAQVQAQLAASFGSAVNYNAGLSTGENTSNSYSNSDSRSDSISASTSTNISTNTSTSTSTSDSKSFSESVSDTTVHST